MSYAEDKDGLGPQTDTVYAALMAAHEGLDTEQSHALNARLVLMMANEIGDPDTLIGLMKKARSYSNPD